MTDDQTVGEKQLTKEIPGLAGDFKAVRKRSTQICQPLETEDYVVQPVVDVSPPKWHLGHGLLK